MFNELISRIFEYSTDNFTCATEKLNSFVSSSANFIDIVEQIGTIPEAIPHDSTEEKLFAKASDAVLSRAFRELGLISTVLPERADSADVIARSPLFEYTLVADAKAFRLSRTAKNQKDFKVNALSGWRKDNDFAVLCSPYFQYPCTQSQIYAQAIENNVCLLSWEHLMFLLRSGLSENEDLNLSTLFSFSESLSHTTVVADKKKCFIRKFDRQFLSIVNALDGDFDIVLDCCINNIKKRGDVEKSFWIREKNAIFTYSRNQAITELIKSKKIDEKIRQIDFFIKGVSYD